MEMTTELVVFMQGCREYEKRILHINIYNTSNFSKWFNNFRIEAIFNTGYKLNFDDLNKTKRYNKELYNIIATVNTGLGYRQFECDDEIESIIKMEEAYQFLQRYLKNIPINYSFKGDGKMTYYKLINKYKEDLINEGREELKKEAGYKLIINRAYLERKLEDIENKIKSNKESYILSQLTNSGLTREDVRKYPNLIKLTDEIIKLKIATK